MARAPTPSVRAGKEWFITTNLDLTMSVLFLVWKFMFQKVNLTRKIYKIISTCMLLAYALTFISSLLSRAAHRSKRRATDDTSKWALLHSLVNKHNETISTYTVNIAIYIPTEFCISSFHNLCIRRIVFFALFTQKRVDDLFFVMGN